MTKQISSKAIPMLEDNIDTDVIFPARFLLLMEKAGIGQYAFYERRSEDPSFVLNRKEMKGRSILLTGNNFGIGSSREQAVWTLADLGIRSIIAQNFGEIFRQNCLRNGLLPIDLDEEKINIVERAIADDKNITIDLEAKAIQIDGEKAIPFLLSDYWQKALIQELNEIEMIFQDDMADIEAFEKRHHQAMPWVPISDEQFDQI